YRETELARKIKPVAQVVDESGARHLETDADHRVFEEQTVFGLLDGFKLGANQLDVIPLQNAGVGKIDGEIQCCLSADCWQKSELPRVRLARKHLRFNADNLFHVVVVQRLDVGAVGQLGIGHDGGRIRVHQHHL